MHEQSPPEGRSEQLPKMHLFSSSFWKENVTLYGSKGKSGFDIDWPQRKLISIMHALFSA